MEEKIYKKYNKIIIEIPYWSKRSNPYMLGEDVGSYQTLTGILDEDKDGNDRFGFGLSIDMDYKDKPDQYTDIKYHFWGEEEDFIKVCKELGIGIVDLRKCSTKSPKATALS